MRLQQLKRKPHTEVFFMPAFSACVSCASPAGACLTIPLPRCPYSRGLPKEVEGLLKTMRREGLTPDKVTFNTAIKAVSSSGQWEKAFSFLSEMKKEGLKPDQVQYALPSYTTT